MLRITITDQFRGKKIKKAATQAFLLFFYLLLIFEIMQIELEYYYKVIQLLSWLLYEDNILHRTGVISWTFHVTDWSTL